MRVIITEATCPACGTVHQRVVIKDDKGQDRIECMVCKRWYWRIDDTNRFTDDRNMANHGHATNLVWHVPA